MTANGTRLPGPLVVGDALCDVDIVTGLLALADSDLPGPVNIGNPEPASTPERR